MKADEMIISVMGGRKKMMINFMVGDQDQNDSAYSVGLVGSACIQRQGVVILTFFLSYPKVVLTLHIQCWPG